MHLEKEVNIMKDETKFRLSVSIEELVDNSFKTIYNIAEVNKNQCLMDIFSKFIRNIDEYIEENEL